MKPEGLFTAIITPFKTDESVDKDALRNIIERQIESRVDAVVPCTVTGENAALSHIEHEWVFEWTVRYVNNRVGVIAATGSNSTREAIHLSLHAQKVGADAVCHPGFLGHADEQMRSAFVKDAHRFLQFFTACQN